MDVVAILPKLFWQTLEKIPELATPETSSPPTRYGTKDKQTTEQAFFNCNICECELKSVVTLRAHCKGSQHIRKALQKKKEFRDAEKLRRAAQGVGGGGGEADTSRFTTLFEWLDSATSEAVVGLEQVGCGPPHHIPWCR